MRDNIDYNLIIELLEDVLGESGGHNELKGQMQFSCPVCSYEINGLDELDGKNNLEVNYKQGVYKCWVCGETHNTRGSLYKLFKKYGTPKQIKKFKLFYPDNTENRLGERVYKKVYLPKEFISFTNVSAGVKLTHQYRQALKYIKSRNITDEMLKRYNIGFCISGIYENRIIIPSYDCDMELNYFIARSFLSNTKMKYKNPEAQKEIIIFNEHLLNWDKSIYLVEGVFDSIFLDNSIPMLGKFMSDHLFNLLYEKAKEVIIVLDPDAYEDQVKLFHKLNCGRLMGKVYSVRLGGNKDLADLCGDISNYKLEVLE